MSGSGRKTSYRKTITGEFLYGSREPKENEHIAQILGMRGSNLFEIQFPNEDQALTFLPMKFRKLIWIKRGDFVIVSGAEEDITTADGGKGAVKFMIEHILYKDQIKNLKDKDLWPYGAEWTKDEDEEDIMTHQLETQLSLTKGHRDIIVDSNSIQFQNIENDQGLFVNRNRQYLAEESSSDEDEEDD